MRSLPSLRPEYFHVHFFTTAWKLLILLHLFFSSFLLSSYIFLFFYFFFRFFFLLIIRFYYQIKGGRLLFHLFLPRFPWWVGQNSPRRIANIFSQRGFLGDYICETTRKGKHPACWRDRLRFTQNLNIISSKFKFMIYIHISSLSSLGLIWLVVLSCHPKKTGAYKKAVNF